MAQRHSGSRATERVLLGVLFLAVAAAGILAILHFSGIYRIAALTSGDSDEARENAALPAGMVLVPAAARNLRAYEQVQGVDLFIARNRAWAEVPMPATRVEEAKVLKDRKDIIGRVLRRDKPSGRVFTEEDFYPDGTRPGLTAGIPPGKRAVRLEVNRIHGLHGLVRGDLVDLVYSFVVESSDRDGTLLPKVGGARGAEIEMALRINRPEKQSTVRIAARNAVVVEPVTVRQMPITSSSLTEGTVTRARPVQEVVLAMDPDEAVALTAALESDARVIALPRSGRSDDPGTSETPALEPNNPYAGKDLTEPDVRVMEVIDGDTKKVIAVPGK